MDRAGALVRLNRRLLEEFSARSVEALRSALPVRLALSELEAFLAGNLEKEIRKDALVIGCVRDALAAGGRPGAEAIPLLLAQGREIDRQFFKTIERLPVRFEVPYARIEPLRRRRIERGFPLVADILSAWATGDRLRDRVPRTRLARELRGILHLYCEEAAALSDGVRLPSLLRPVRDRLADRLLGLMRAAADRVTADIAAQKPR